MITKGDAKMPENSINITYSEKTKYNTLMQKITICDQKREKILEKTLELSEKETKMSQKKSSDNRGESEKLSEEIGKLNLVRSYFLILRKTYVASKNNILKDITLRYAESCLTEMNTCVGQYANEKETKQLREIMKGMVTEINACTIGGKLHIKFSGSYPGSDSADFVFDTKKSTIDIQSMHTSAVCMEIESPEKYLNDMLERYFQIKKDIDEISKKLESISKDYSNLIYCEEKAKYPIPFPVADVVCNPHYDLLPDLLENDAFLKI